MKQRILVVDDDPWIRQMVSTMLDNAGFHVACANNGADGLEQTKVFQPDLIISDVVMDTMDGWTFVHALRATPEYSLIPVIFLTACDDQQDRVRGFQIGADDYLAKPFHFDELNLRIQRTLRSLARLKERARAVQKHSDPNVALRGDLAQLGIGALLSILEMERKSGILLVDSGDQRCRIFLRDGRALDAFAQPGDAKGVEALYELLAWTAGSFSFTALDVDMDDAIGLPMSHVLMEGARRLDEARQTARKSAGP